ncbi:MAG: hypothetical protein ACM33B_01890 [Pseudomonadota bacterium]
MDRLTVVAPLREGTEDAAAELIASGPPFDPDASGLAAHWVFLSPREVVFVFEGGFVENVVRDLVDDPVIAATFSRWGPLLDGPPRLARERYRWPDWREDER